MYNKKFLRAREKSEIFPTPSAKLPISPTKIADTSLSAIVQGQAKLRLAWYYRTAEAEATAPATWVAAQAHSKRASTRSRAPAPATENSSICTTGIRFICINPTYALICIIALI
jgi:hypothetical protein